MAMTYEQTGTWKNYPRNVRVAKDGSVVRILGAFFGYGTDQVTVWTPRLAKITEALDRWRLSQTAGGT